MKLLFDQNLSGRIPSQIPDLFPDSTHVKAIDLERADDDVIGEWAKENGYVIISKDTDFYQRSMVLGHPPKFIWLRVWNCSTSFVVDLLRARADIINEFGASAAESVLILSRVGS